MNREAAVSGEIAEASLVLMLRAGLIQNVDVLAIADEYELRAGRERCQVRSGVLVEAAHRLRTALLNVASPPKVDPAVEFQAAFERKQIRLRTAYLDRKRREADGGNDAG